MLVLLVEQHRLAALEHPAGDLVAGLQADGRGQGRVHAAAGGDVQAVVHGVVEHDRDLAGPGLPRHRFDQVVENLLFARRRKELFAEPVERQQGAQPGVLLLQPVSLHGLADHPHEPRAVDRQLNHAGEPALQGGGEGSAVALRGEQQTGDTRLQRCQLGEHPVHVVARVVLHDQGQGDAAAAAGGFQFAPVTAVDHLRQGEQGQDRCRPGVVGGMEKNNGSHAGSDESQVVAPW